MPSRPYRPLFCGLLRAILLLLASSVLPVVSAVRINFDNCLSDSYIWTKQDPAKVQLQFVPLAADAVFEAQGENHSLLVTVWGNVTGRVGDATLPGRGDPAWDDPKAALGGKIQNSLTGANATTLHSTVDVLTYRPYTHDSYFCESLLGGSACPLAPTFNQTEL